MKNKTRNMADTKDNNRSIVMARKLEGQIEEMMELFDFGEKIYPYEQSRAEKMILNEDERRRQLARGANYGPTAASVLDGSILWGFGAVYLYSRPGAATLFDMSPIRRNFWACGAVFMLATGFGGIVQATKLAEKHGNSTRVQLHNRVQENESVHSILRSMKFHIMTRSMSIWDQYGE